MDDVAAADAATLAHHFNGAEADVRDHEWPIWRDAIAMP